MRPLGLDIELQQLENAAANDAQRAGRFDLALSNGPGCSPFGDADYALRRILSSTSSLNVGGHGGFRNDEADRLLEQARTTIDASAQAALYDRLQKIAVAEVPLSLLYGEQQIVAHAREVHDLHQRILYQPTFDTAFLAR